MKELSEDRIRIIKEYLEGEPVIKMAEKRGISREAVYQTLRRLENWDQIKESKQEERVTGNKEVAYEAANQIKKGRNVSDVLDEYNISATTLYRYHPEMSSYKRKQSYKITEKIAKDWEAGMTYVEISKKYDMFISNIQRRLHLYYGNKWKEAKKNRKLNSRK